MKQYKGYPQELMELDKHKRRLQDMISYIDRRIDHVNRQVIRRAKEASEMRQSEQTEEWNG